MSLQAASLPADLSGLLAALDLPRVRSRQGWVLRVMRRDGPALVRMLWRMLGREQDVLDAYQECMCKLMARHERDGRVPHRGYVFRAAMNIALDARRHRKVRSDQREAVAIVRTSLRSESNATCQPPNELVATLRAAIADLPDRLRDVIVLRDLAEMSYRDVGRTLGLTPGTARVYRREAIKALATRLSE